MAVKKTKTLKDVSTVNTVNMSQMIPLTDGVGNVTKISLADLKASLLAGLDLDAIEDGVFIMIHRNSDDFPLIIKPHKWGSYQDRGEIAEGVALVEGGKILVVAPTEALLHWSSTVVSGGGTVTNDRITAFNDWKGKDNTAVQLTHAECNTASYAPGYCAAYSRVNVNGAGLTTGKWWLPSIGELMMIYANAKKINYALSLINGATQLVEDWYWSSTEYSATYAWYLYFGHGTVTYSAKASNRIRVRAISAFIQ